MSFAAYLREIGRGKDGARSLDRDQAEDLLRQVYEGRVSDVQLGAFAIAMRIKGESAAELAGFVAATRAHLAPALVEAVSRSARPVVWLPSYNGARKLPNLTPLLAGLLAASGCAVLVHGLPDDPGRVTSHAVFEALGWPVLASSVAATQAEAQLLDSAWAAQRPVFVPTAALCPPLARLLAVRRETGLRNSGHTLAKLLSSDAPSKRAQWRVVNHTHPEYAVSLAEFLGASGANAMLLRGTEGEPVADARRTPRMDVFVVGQRIDALGVPAQGGVLASLPELRELSKGPGGIEAASTARFIQSCLRETGSTAVPGPLLQQVAAIVGALRHIEQSAE